MTKKKLAIIALLILSITTGISTAAAIFYYRETLHLSDMLASVQVPNEIDNGNMVSSKIFFSKDPDSYNADFSYTVSVNRLIDKASPVESSMEKLMQGPSTDEGLVGLKNPIELSGESNCSGEPFRVVTNSTELGSDIEVHFCKDVKISGVGDTARIQAVINKTILDLETSAKYKVGRIAILDKNNNCLGDDSGKNACLD